MEVKDKYVDNSNGCDQTVSHKKYGLRPRSKIKRLQLERSLEDMPERAPKSSKNRPRPLSKYRRKTANARERHRMKEINAAFETLRQILPDFCSRQAASSMTKYTTLKLAVSYIRTLSHILEDRHPPDVSFFDGLTLEEASMVHTELPLQRTHKRGYFMHANHDVNHRMLIAPPKTNWITSSSFSKVTPVNFLSSTGSNSDLQHLMPNASCVFEETLAAAFEDIPPLSEVDVISLLMVQDTNSFTETCLN